MVEGCAWSCARVSKGGTSARPGKHNAKECSAGQFVLEQPRGIDLFKPGKPSPIVRRPHVSASLSLGSLLRGKLWGEVRERESY